MCILGIIRTDKPRSASEIGILRVKLHRAISLALPGSQQPIEGDLLDGAIVCIRRAGTTETDNRAGSCGVRRVGKEVASVIVRAVINGERLLWTRSPLQAGRT